MTMQRCLQVLLTDNTKFGEHSISKSTSTAILTKNKPIQRYYDVMTRAVEMF